MTGNREWLIDLESNVNSSMRFVYNSTTAVEGGPPSPSSFALSTSLGQVG